MKNGSPAWLEAVTWDRLLRRLYPAVLPRLHPVWDWLGEAIERSRVRPDG